MSVLPCCGQGLALASDTCIMFIFQGQLVHVSMGAQLGHCPPEARVQRASVSPGRPSAHVLHDGPSTALLCLFPTPAGWRELFQIASLVTPYWPAV